MEDPFTGCPMLQCNIADVPSLITWALQFNHDENSPEVGPDRQRHAKTMEQAQREVRAIVGVLLLSRTKSISYSYLAQKQAAELLFGLCVNSLRSRLPQIEQKVQRNACDCGSWEQNCSRQETDPATPSNSNKSAKRKQRRKKQRRQRLEAQRSTASTPPSSNGSIAGVVGSADTTDAHQLPVSSPEPPTSPEDTALTDEDQISLDDQHMSLDSDMINTVRTLSIESEESDSADPSPDTSEDDDALVAEMEALRAQLGNMKKKRENLRTKLRGAWQATVNAGST